MGFLTDLARQYSASVPQHTGLHYVPSFLDLNSCSNDDMEEDVLRRERGESFSSSSSLNLMAPSPPKSSGMMMGMPALRPTPRSTSLSRTSNKADDLPAIDPLVVDIHRTGRHTNIDGRKQWMYDMPKSGSTNRPNSVWEEILRSSSSSSSSKTGAV